MDTSFRHQDAGCVLLHFHGWAERGGDFAERVEITLAVRAAGADTGALRHFYEGRLHVTGSATFLGEAGADDQCVFHAGLGAFLQRGGDAGGGDCHQRKIDWSADCGN